MSTTVALSLRDCIQCAAHGLRRMLDSDERGLNHASTYERDFLVRLRQETVGVCGELAFCRWAGIEYTWPINTFHWVPDAGDRHEIRATDRVNGCLIVRENDVPDRVYWLVVGQPSEMTVVGWLRGVDARQDRWRRDPWGYRGSWFVPQEVLRPAVLPQHQQLTLGV